MSQPKGFMFPFFLHISADRRIAFSDMTVMCVIHSHFLSYNPSYFFIVCFTFLHFGQSPVSSKMISWCLHFNLQSCFAFPLVFVLSLSVSMMFLQVNLLLQPSSGWHYAVRHRILPGTQVGIWLQLTYLNLLNIRQQHRYSIYGTRDADSVSVRPRTRSNSEKSEK